MYFDGLLLTVVVVVVVVVVNRCHRHWNDRFVILDILSIKSSSIQSYIPPTPKKKTHRLTRKKEKQQE